MSEHIPDAHTSLTLWEGMSPTEWTFSSPVMGRRGFMVGQFFPVSSFQQGVAEKFAHLHTTWTHGNGSKFNIASIALKL